MTKSQGIKEFRKLLNIVQGMRLDALIPGRRLHEQAGIRPKPFSEAELLKLAKLGNWKLHRKYPLRSAEARKGFKRIIRAINKRVAEQLKSHTIAAT